MSAYIRGYLECNGCGQGLSTVAELIRHNELWWALPEGWEIYGTGPLFVVCPKKCRRPSGYPTQTSTANSAALTFDPKAIDHVHELLQSAGNSADVVLLAIEAALIAWRKGRS